MARRRKDYRVAPSPTPLIGGPDMLVVNFVRADGTFERSFDFTVFGRLPMAAELALAFRHHLGDKATSTRFGTYRRLFLWFAFIAEHDDAITSMRDVDTAVMRTFIASLDAKPWTKGSRHSAWSCIKQLAAWLQRNRPELVHPDLDIPFNAFPRKNSETPPRAAMSRNEMERVLSAARVDIALSWAAFQAGRAALARVDRAAIAAEDDLARLDLDDNMNSSRIVAVMPDYLVSAHVRRFVDRHDLRDDRGHPLRLSIAALRASGLTLAHERLGHDILKTQALANHTTPDTTQRYVDRPLIRQAQAIAVGALQARFVEMVRGEPDAEASEAPDINVRHASASGFICADPMGGVAEGQRAGQLCTAWLGCFTCPNAVIPLDAEMLVRLNATRAALIDVRSGMAPDRWRLLYAPKLEILERDILPRFPDALHDMVARRTLPRLPPIE